MTNLHERIQQYLDGELTGKELQGFEQALQTDRALAEELALMQEVRNAVNFNQEIKGKETQLKGTLSEVGEKYFETESTGKIDPPIIPIRRILAVAASVLLLVGLGSFWWANSHYTNHALITEFYEPLLDYKKANVSKEEVLLKKAKDAFFAQQYAIAIPDLAKIPQSAGKTYYEAQGLLAYSLFGNYDFEGAISQFTLLIENYYDQLPIEFQDKNRLRWSRLLAYVGNDDIENVLFEKELAYFINHESQVYQKRAKELTNKLDSNFRLMITN